MSQVMRSPTESIAAEGSSWRLGGCVLHGRVAVTRRTSSSATPCSQQSDSRRSVVVHATPPRGGKAGKLPEASRVITSTGVDTVKEAHKVFDEVFITVKSGNGGRGEIVEAGRGKWVDNFKYKPGGNQPKRMWLPASDPADGADGADVVLKCDPGVENLLHLHQRTVYSARNGSNANPSVGSAGPKKNKKIKKAYNPPLVISVPPGTVVKRKSTGALVGELINPGDVIVVARGGQGGSGVRAPTREANRRELDRQTKLAQDSGAEVVAVEDTKWQAESKGMPGVQLSLHLLLRVVADVGIVGFPNAGKSSLLAALTRADPEVAPYPFTTLMPNLGVLSAEPHQEKEEFHIPGRSKERSSKTPVLADLPGLIEGAHKGRGLGRMFLRHLRRTSALLHVVDASAADPATDYYAVREELRMYNPEYCAKPHVVALNKMDMEDAGGLRDELTVALKLTAERHSKEWEAEEIKPTPPVAIVPCSALSGEGLDDLRAAIQDALEGRRAARTPQERKRAAEERSKQALSASVAAALGVSMAARGAASTGAAAGAAGGEEEGKVEVASEAELLEQERQLLGLSEEELLRMAGEGDDFAAEAGVAMLPRQPVEDGWEQAAALAAVVPPHRQPGAESPQLQARFGAGGQDAWLAAWAAPMDEGEGVEDGVEEGEWVEEVEEGEEEEVGEEGLSAEEAKLLGLSEEDLLKMLKD